MRKPTVRDTYKVWIEIEKHTEFFENGELVEDSCGEVDLPCGSCYEAETLDEALKFAKRLHELAGQLKQTGMKGEADVGN